MSAPAVWLVEALDAAGAAIEDVHLHARALAAAGYPVRAFVADEDGLEEIVPGRDVQRAGGAPELALAASAHPGGGAATRHLPRGAAWAWWPTGFASGPRWSIGRRAPLLGWDADGAASCPGLAGSTCESSPRKRPVPMWDGEVVLVPAPLDRRSGADLIDAFARAAEHRAALDLIVLGDPQPRFAADARTAGIGARVHFAGRATREAEHAWFSSAVALLVDADAPVSGGLVLRALKRGVPVVPAGGGAAARTLRAWLTAHGCLDGTDGPLAATLGAALARPEAFAARAHAAAGDHALAALGRRLASAIDDGAHRRAA